MKGHLHLTMAAAVLSLFISCNKHHDSPARTGSFQVAIDSANVVAFTTIHVVASYQGGPVTATFRLGLCWGKTPDPTATADTIFQPKGTPPPLDTAISNLDSNTVYYIRAFCISGVDTIYSPQRSIKTGGLSVVWDMEYPETEGIGIVQVSPVAGGFIVLSEIYPPYGSNTWSRLTRLDSNGNILWKSDYDNNQYKIPDHVLVQPDGYVVAAHMPGPATNTAILYKTDLNGNQLWEDQFVDSIWATQLPGQLYEGDSATIMLTTRARNTDPSTGYILGPLLQYRVDQNGNLLGKQTYPNVMSVNSVDVFTTPIDANGYLVLYDGDSVVGGGSYVPDIRAQVYSPANGLAGDESFYGGGGKEQYPVACQNDSSGNYVVLAATSAQGTTDQSSWLFGLDRGSGNIKWQNVYGNTKFGTLADTYPSAFAASGQQDYYVAGFVWGSAFLLKTDNQGNYIWDYTFANAAGVSYTRTYAVFVYPGNELYLFGTATVNGNSLINMFLRKLQEY